MGLFSAPIDLTNDDLESLCSSAVKFPSPQDIARDLQSFDDMVDDLATRFWGCQNCLGMRHKTETCTNKIRCRNCFRSGHIKKNSTGQPPVLSIWVPKVPSPGFGTRATVEPSPASSVSPPQKPQSSSPAQPLQSQSPSPPPQQSSPMAVYALDPRRFLPAGYDIIDGGAERVRRTYFFPAQAPPRMHEQFMVAAVNRCSTSSLRLCWFLFDLHKPGSRERDFLRSKIWWFVVLLLSIHRFPVVWMRMGESCLSDLFRMTRVRVFELFVATARVGLCSSGFL